MELNDNIFRMMRAGGPVETFNGVPSEALIREKRKEADGPLLLVLDDLMLNLSANFLNTLFTRGSHLGCVRHFGHPAPLHKRIESGAQ